MNLETYITNFDASSVIESVLKANNVEPDDNHMKVHMQYIRTKLDSLKKAYKSKDYFKDFPILDTDYASYVIGN